MLRLAAKGGRRVFQHRPIAACILPALLATCVCVCIPMTYPRNAKNSCVVDVASRSVTHYEDGPLVHNILVSLLIASSFVQKLIIWKNGRSLRKDPACCQAHPAPEVRVGSFLPPSRPARNRQAHRHPWLAQWRWFAGAPGPACPILCGWTTTEGVSHTLTLCCVLSHPAPRPWCVCASTCRSTRKLVVKPVAYGGGKVDIKKQGLNSIENDVVQQNLMGRSRFMRNKEWRDAQGRKGKVGCGRYCSASVLHRGASTPSSKAGFPRGNLSRTRHRQCP